MSAERETAHAIGSLLQRVEFLEGRAAALSLTLHAVISALELGGETGKAVLRLAVLQNATEGFTGVPPGSGLAQGFQQEAGTMLSATQAGGGG